MAWKGSTPAANPAEALVTDYLSRLRRATADLPDDPRTELLDNISLHLRDATAEDASEAHLRTVIDQLGTPEEIAAAARAESGSRPAPTQGERFYDVATALVLLLGGFIIPVLGWVVGVGLLWAGPRWNTTQKVLGTLIWPLVILVGLCEVFFPSSAGSVVLWTGATLIVLGFPATFVYLIRPAGSQRA